MSQTQSSRSTLGVSPGYHDGRFELLNSITRKDCAFPSVKQGVIFQQGDCVSRDLQCGWRASGLHVRVRFGDLRCSGSTRARHMRLAGSKFMVLHTMPRSDRLTASYRSGVRFVGLMLPAPPWMMSRGLILGEETGRLYSMLSGLAHNEQRHLKQHAVVAKLDPTAAAKRWPEDS